jgi:hypothetical protein
MARLTRLFGRVAVVAMFLFVAVIVLGLIRSG